MSFAVVMFAPLVLLFPAGESGAAHAMVEAGALAAGRSDGGMLPRHAEIGWVFDKVAQSFRVETQNQVRVEQHMTIRISPSRPRRMPRNFILDLPRREIGPRFTERAIGRCLPAEAISGVQADAGNRLILFLRDRRMISAILERACRPRDFYSGFYIERTSDGQLCVDRDTLLSRSGVNCKLTRIRQLIDLED